MDVVNEGTTTIITVSFYNENNEPITPDSVIYRLDDIYSGTEIKDDTSITPGESVDITISSTENRIVNRNRPVEKRIMSVKYTYAGNSKTGYDSYIYMIQNLDYADKIE